jgi:hypothetical protein
MLVSKNVHFFDLFSLSHFFMFPPSYDLQTGMQEKIHFRKSVKDMKESGRSSFPLSFSFNRHFYIISL